MKIFFIGGLTTALDSPQGRRELAQLEDVVQTVMKPLIAAGHQFNVCSPFADSVDAQVVSNFVSREAKSPANALRQSELLVFYPKEKSVLEKISELLKGCPVTRIRTFPQALAYKTDGKIDWNHSWLLAQLAALDDSELVLAIGGRAEGTANLLLLLAEGRGRPILPLGYLGGAASLCLSRRWYQLEDSLDGGDLSALQNAGNAAIAGGLIEKIANPKFGKLPMGRKPRFFISYPRERHAEADFVEMILRRRNLEVFRDEHDFEKGEYLFSTINEHIHRANVFIAIWCKEYACSPWCYDELDLALQRRQEGNVRLWILAIDNTRLVHPGARGLLTIPCRDREDIAGKVMEQILTMQAA
jgi:hypothetical protein